eukprot:TRINITY_DN866_c0_g1_i4.p2 TRINITY_DN866_c0_g1~~TRINITY_DN866_c0_g1_i4.p2  ORF type:complete len:132 (-),score=50.97 TRINITY_DN866_c0_g1_i4:58-453(-)
MLRSLVGSEMCIRDRFLGSVCHGALGFIRATKPDGSLLCNGTKMTGVTNKQIEQLGIASVTPYHPQDELVKAGAEYQCKHGFLTDLLSNDVVTDGRIVTCLLYTSDAADEEDSVDLGGRRIIKKKKERTSV